MDVHTVLMERYVSDLRKPNVDNKERAIILKKICEEKKWSIRELARQFGFNKSTVQDWMLWDDPRVDELKAKGASDTEIYRILRENTAAKGKKTKFNVKKKTAEASLVDARLKKMAAELKSMVAGGAYSDETKDLVKEVINQCNRFDSLIKRKVK